MGSGNRDICFPSDVAARSRLAGPCAVHLHDTLPKVQYPSPLQEGGSIACRHSATVGFDNDSNDNANDNTNANNTSYAAWTIGSEFCNRLDNNLVSNICTLIVSSPVAYVTLTECGSALLTNLSDMKTGPIFTNAQRSCSCIVECSSDFGLHLTLSALITRNMFTY
jgi:hypothetical protein